MTESAPEKSKTFKQVAIGCVVFFFVLPVLGILFAVVIPTFLTYEGRLKETKNAKYKSKHSQAQMHLQAIRTAQIAYHAEHDVYVPIEPYPPYVGKEKYVWTPELSGGFQTIGWAPDGYAQGAYSVTTTEDDFQVIGILDVDGDGLAATYIATKDSLPVRISAKDVY